MTLIEAIAHRFFGWPLLALTLLIAGGCGTNKPDVKPHAGDMGGEKPMAGETTPMATEDLAGLSGTIKIDGSSTVFLISQAVAEDFTDAGAKVKLDVGSTGTGTGFKRLIAGEIDIADASRPIKEDEAAKCKENGIEYVELQVAYDGLAVIVHKDNDWVDCITVDQLKKIWEAGSTVKNWSDIDPKWPAEPIKLYGPGRESGTFDYFTEAINKKAKSSREDYAASADDNVLVTGVAGSKYAMGYFGYAYYFDNKDKIKVLSVKSKGECVAPSDETVLNGTYEPLARPLFIYVKKASLKRPEVVAFVKFYLAHAEDISKNVHYVPTPHKIIEDGQKKLDETLVELK